MHSTTTLVLTIHRNQALPLYPHSIQTPSCPPLKQHKPIHLTPIRPNSPKQSSDICSIPSIPPPVQSNPELGFEKLAVDGGGPSHPGYRTRLVFSSHHRIWGTVFCLSPSPHRWLHIPISLTTYLPRLPLFPRLRRIEGDLSVGGIGHRGWLVGNEATILAFCLADKAEVSYSGLETLELWLDFGSWLARSLEKRGDKERKRKGKGSKQGKERKKKLTTWATNNQSHRPGDKTVSQNPEPTQIPSPSDPMTSPEGTPCSRRMDWGIVATASSLSPPLDRETSCLLSWTR